MSYLEKQKLEECFLKFVSPTKSPKIFKKNPKVISSSFHFKPEKYLDIFSPLENSLLPLSLKKAPLKRKSEFISSRLAIFLTVNKNFFKFFHFFTQKKWFQSKRKKPHWPKGLLGSITHSDSFVSVALTTVKTISNLGIDSQKIKKSLIENKALLKSLEEKISNKDEILSLNHKMLPYWLSILLIFSSKESLYKSLSHFNFPYQSKNITLDFTITSLKDLSPITKLKKTTEKPSKKKKAIKLLEKKINGTFKIKNFNSNYKKKLLMNQNLMDFTQSRENSRKYLINEFLEKPWKFGIGEFEIKNEIIHTSFVLK